MRLAHGFAYLAAIIDWGSRKILSWKLSNTMDVSLTTSVLKDALVLYGQPKIFNTDQGSQCTAQEHVALLSQKGIAISMDVKGRSDDNFAIVRFWRSLKYEDVYLKNYRTIAETRKGIDDYINCYNEVRLHSKIDYATPDEVYFQNHWKMSA